MLRPISLNFPNTIEFGEGKISTLPAHLSDCKRVFILVDPPILDKIKPTIEEIKSNGSEVNTSTEVVPEPPFESLENLLAPVKSFNPDAIVGVGGGSAMDMAKVISVLFSGEQSINDIIGIGQVKNRTVKLISASTTSGTGSEVTPIAVLTDVEQKLKKGVVSPFLIPDVAIVDPSLTVSLPASVTAATGMDAMTHCIEAYTNVNSHPIIDNYAIEGVSLIAKNLEKAIKDGSDIKAREALALGSLYGGLCLGPVNTAAVHALAYPLGGEYKISHGVSNSVLLPFVMSYNLPNCIEKYSNIGRAIGLDPHMSKEDRAKEAIRKIREISDKCGIPASLKELDIPEDAIPHMAKSAMNVKRLLDNNPREIKEKDAIQIFENAFNGIIT